VTRIRIPWFFQMVPDDRRQGEVLAREIFQVRGIRSAAAWVEKGLDPQSAADAFEKYAPADAVSRFPAGDPAARQDLLARAGKGEFGAVILFAGSGAATESLRGTPAIEEFRREFQKTYGSLPTLVAAYSHDAVKALVEALRKLPAPESDGLAEALAGIRTNGVTGEIRFDKRLGREAVPILAQVKGSELVPLATEVPAGRR
jgi:ABC-type branched-subunit amino acid transport system substrate-binding protein